MYRLSSIIFVPALPIRAAANLISWTKLRRAPEPSYRKLLISGYVHDRDYAGRPINLPWPNHLFYSDWNGYVQHSFMLEEISTKRVAYVRSNPLWKCDAVAYFFCAYTFFVSVRVASFSSPCNEKNQHRAMQI